MSDLIDFDSPSTGNIGLLLPSPLIPAPENLRNDGSNSNEAGPHVTESEKRCNAENNPFDMVMKKIIDYERNKEDPFETVIEKVKEFSSRVSDESKDSFLSKSIRYSDIVKRNKTLEETEINLNIPLIGESDMSIISDLNNTNLICDSTNENQVTSLSCDNKIPSIHISSTSCNTDLSILNNSSMNDSLLDCESNNIKDIKDLPDNINNRFRSMSQTNVLGNKKLLPQTQNKRSMSTSDAMKNNIFGEDCLLNSAHSSLFEDPFNNAFRKNSLRSTISSNSSYLSNQFDLSINKQNLERQTSNSSVFSGLSNISTITVDPAFKIRHDRFCSESSAFSGISNLSTISTNNIVSSSDSSVFSNDTLNKGFITSRIHSSNSSTDKSPLKLRDKSDLIKKFFEIKTRMSTSEIEQLKNKDKKDFIKKKSNSFSKYNVSPKAANLQNSDEKLIDVDSSFNSVFNEETGVKDIISHEAKLLAETFEKMASSEESNSSHEDDLLSKTQLNFDYLPKSDDEIVDNLIDLPTSPIKNISLSKTDLDTEKDNETNVISPRDKIMALENEFIEKKDFDKKAVTATLMLDLEKLIQEQNNPDAFKVLNDLQKLLGVECDNNTEILQLHLQNANDSFQSKNEKIDRLFSSKNTNNSNNELNTSNANKLDDYFSLIENSEKKQNNINTSNLKLDVSNELKEKTKNEKIVNNSQYIKESEIKGKNLDELSENTSLAGDLINSLNKIINEKNENSAVDILRSLGTVLKMVTESRTKNNDKQTTDSKISKKNTQMKMYRSSNSLYKSPNSKNFNKKDQSFEVLPLRRSISTNPTYNSNLLDIPFTRDKRKSHLLNIKKRFPSDPGFKNILTEKKVNEISVTVEHQFHLKTNETTAQQVKTKFKKKLNSEIITKKGPLKAVIPLGNMQKRGLINQSASSHNVTPPKPPDSTITMSIVSSTPNTSGVNKNSKSQPTASSTPNIEGLRKQRTKAQNQRNSKSTSMCNVSPVSLNSSLKENVGISRNNNKRMERTLSPQKRPMTPRKNSDCNIESRLPKYSPRPVRVRNYSLDDLKTAKSPPSIGNMPKFSSEKKLNRHSVLSPLKNFNKHTHKGKLVSRFEKPSNIKFGSEKENYA